MGEERGDCVHSGQQEEWREKLRNLQQDQSFCSPPASLSGSLGLVGPGACERTGGRRASGAWRRGRFSEGNRGGGGAEVAASEVGQGGGHGHCGAAAGVAGGGGRARTLPGLGAAACAWLGGHHLRGPGRLWPWRAGSAAFAPRPPGGGSGVSLDLAPHIHHTHTL